MCSRIEMEGPVYNTRDLGGYTVKDGRTIRHYRLLEAVPLENVQSLISDN